MRTSQFDERPVVELIRRARIATFDQVAQALGSPARRTVFRKLGEIGALSSYSHCGSYYTLPEIADFDEYGLWEFRGVRFCRHGTLRDSVVAIVEAAEAGWSCEELDQLLGVVSKDALRHAVNQGSLSRHVHEGRYVYFAVEASTRRAQEVARRARHAEPRVAGPLPTEVAPEVRSAIALFFSALDEKQRRLYAGLESLKIGHGGDTRIAHLLDLHPATVARGRRELLERDELDPSRVRRAGAGRKEKKRRS